MKRSEFRKLIREEISKVLKERRIPFKGKSVNQLYNIVKNEPNVLVFANGQEYSLLDTDEMKNDLNNTITYGYTKDGDEVELKVSDIEFITV